MPGRVQHAVDPRARRLRLGADDADLLPEQRVQQRGLADVRPARERGEAAADRRLVAGGSRIVDSSVMMFSCARPRASSTRCAASCSARRRLEPSPVARSAEARQPRSSRRTTARAARRRPRPARSPAARRPRACSPSCSRVFGSLSVSAEGSSRSAVAEQPLDHVAGGLDAAVEVDRAEHRLEASARMESRRKPPDFSSPLPSRSWSPRSSSAADRRERLAAHQRGADSGSGRPRARPGTRGTRAAATAKLSTASPRNSRRS